MPRRGRKSRSVRLRPRNRGRERTVPGGRRWSAVVVAFGMVLAACSQQPLSAGDGDESPANEPATGSNADLQLDETAALPESDGEAVEEDGDESESDGDVSSDEFEPAPDGYLVWTHPLEPVGLAVAEPVDGGLYTTSWIREGMLEGLYRMDSEWRQVPELLSADASVTVNDNGRVSITYTLRPDLRWSDGQPLTAADVEYTHRILMEGCLTEADGSAIDVSNEGCVYPLSDRSGYDLVTSFDVVDDTTFTVTMAAFYPDWRSLYSQVFAAHSFGDDAATVEANLQTMTAGGRPLPSSGPLVLQNWADHSMRLKANDGYHGSVSGGASTATDSDGGEGGAGNPVTGVQINFVSSPPEAVAQVAAGTADLAIVGSDLDLLGGLGPVVGVQPLPALEFEHLGLNLLNPHLTDPLVRQALVRAVDRRALASVLGEELSPAITADGVGNVFWLPGQSGYQDHQPEALAADPAGAAQLLEQAGYVRTGDGSFRHPERGTPFLRFTTNSGDSVRVALQERLMAQLAEAGFEVVTDNQNGAAYLTEGPFSAEAMSASHSGGSSGRSDIWDMVLFAWAGGPWPGLQSGAFRANSGANPYGYANAEFDTESSRCDGLADDAERATCYQQLDTFVTTLEQGNDGLFVVPLIERPQVMIYNSDRVAGTPSVVDGPSGGPLADITGFTLR